MEEPGFHDYTIASPLERFVAVLESALKTWHDTGLQSIVKKGTSQRQRELPSLVKVQVALKHRLKWRREAYLLSLHLPAYVMLDEVPASIRPSPPSRQTSISLGDSTTLQQAGAQTVTNTVTTTPHISIQDRKTNDIRSELSDIGKQSTPIEAVAAGPSAGTDEVASGPPLHDGDDDGGGGGWGPNEDTPGWEVGVTLDMQRMLQDIDQIMEQDSDPGYTSQSQQDLTTDTTDTWQDTMQQPLQEQPPSQPRTAPSPWGAASVQHSQQHVPQAVQHPQQHVPQHVQHPQPGTSQTSKLGQQSEYGRTTGGTANIQRSGSTQGDVSLPWWPLRGGYRQWWRHTHQHKLQHWFGLDHFLLLQPHSFSKRFLDDHEAQGVLSSVACALSNCGLSWPILIPIHDALRDAYSGVVRIPPSDLRPGGTSVRLMADCVHITRAASDPLLTLQGQVRLFSDQLAASSPSSAAICREYLQSSTHHTGTITTSSNTHAAPYTSQQGRLCVHARHTWRMPLPMPLGTGYRHSIGKRPSMSSGGASSCGSCSWDDDSSWSPWAAHVDPVGCIELDVVWQDVCLWGERKSDITGADPSIGGTHSGHHSSNQLNNTPIHPTPSSTGTTHSPPPSSSSTPSPSSWPELPPMRAKHWVVHVLQRGLTDESGAVFGLLLTERHRLHVRLGDAANNPVPLTPHASGYVDWSLPGMDGTPDPTNSRSFHAMLARLASLRHLAGGVPTTMGEIAGDSWWWDRSRTPGVPSALPMVPSEGALAAIIMDVWEGPPVGTPLDSRTADISPKQAMAAVGSIGSNRLVTGAGGVGQQDDGVVLCKGYVSEYRIPAPLDSPLTRLALHALMCGNPRAVALLWTRFLRCLRLDRWEEGVRLPLGGGAGGGAGADTQPDLTSCLLHQKLQVLDVCIARATSKCAMGVRVESLTSAGNEDMMLMMMSDSRPTMSVPVRDDVVPISNGGSAGEGGGGNDEGFYSADEDEEVLAGEGPRARVPRGVMGVVEGAVLTRHPDRPLRVPITQARPVLSEDRRRERVAQLISLSKLEVEGVTVVPGCGIRMSSDGHVDEASVLAGEVLVSDMAAFKAANPGAVLQDFVAWQQTPGQRLAPPTLSLGPLSSTSSANVPEDWSWVWDTTTPSPANLQKPLQDPLVEGERVLHDLDTLDVTDVTDMLLAHGLAAVVHLLSNAQGARLPPVAQLCERFHRLSSGIVQSSCALATPTGVPPHPHSHPHSHPHPDQPASQSQGGRRLTGFQDHALDFLLDELQYLEAAVVLAESICLRLPSCHELSSSLMQSATQGKASTIVPTHVQAPIIGIAQPLQLLREHICSAEVASQSARGSLARVLLRPSGYSHVARTHPQSDEPHLMSGDDTEPELHNWPPAGHHEWVLTVGTGQEEQVESTSLSGGSTLRDVDRLGPHLRLNSSSTPDSRMYVCHSGGQTRCCFALVSE